MSYKINCKDYTEFDINKRCADIRISQFDEGSEYDKILAIAMRRDEIKYCTCPQRAWTIIEKCWDELMGHTMQMEKPVNYSTTFQGTKWQYLMQKHNCTKLVAACICFIEMNED